MKSKQAEEDDDSVSVNVNLTTRHMEETVRFTVLPQ